MSFTTEGVAGIEFSSSAIGKRGYAKGQVDEFLRRIAKTFAGQDDLTAAEVHHVLFSPPLLGKRGYDEREVDEFLDAVENELIDRTGAPAPEVPGAREHGQATAERAQRDVPAIDNLQDN
jgi:DivIVA domain-containing protein